MNFDGIIGQKQVINTLVNSLKNDRVGHAYLFVGPKGIGKKTVARDFAGMILCENSHVVGSCMDCKSCRLFFSKSNPDYIELEIEGTSIYVEDIRNMLNSIVIRPVYSDKKVYLIPDADRMTIQAQNSLLKTLEEPPDYSVLILTTSNADALIDTVRSRVSRYDFIKNTANEVYEYLKNNFTEDLEGINFIASYSNGIIGTAKDLAQSGELMSLRENVFNIIQKLSKPKLIEVFEMYPFFEENKDRIGIILDIMTFFYRDMIILKNMEHDKLLINSDKKDIILKNALNCSNKKLLKNIDIIEEARSSIMQNVNFQLSIEIMLMRLQEEF
ncbi:MAG TPA: AAA family ATPase [Clostridiaceae bacterium]|nr:AAA family ATPase [Clostridiaceae bacterium]